MGFSSMFEARMEAVTKAFKRNRNKLFTALKIAVGVVLAAGLVLGALALFTDTFKHQITVNSISVTEDEMSTLLCDGDYMYFLGEEMLRKQDTDGRNEWRVSSSPSETSLAIGENVICTYSQDTATVYDKSLNALYTVPSSEYSISKAVCGKNCVAFMSDVFNDDLTYVRVFDSLGTEIYRTSFENSVINIGFYSDNDNIWVLSIDTKGVNTVSRITTCSPSQNTLTGIIEITDQLVSDVMYFSDSFRISGTDYLVEYDTFGNKGTSTLVYGLRCIDYAVNGGNNVLVYMSRSAKSVSEASNVRVLSKNGEDETDIFLQFPDVPSGCCVTPSYIYCMCASRVYVYTLSGSLYKTIELKFTPMHLKKISQGLVAVIDDAGAAHLIHLS